ncbi:MAG TPA: serine/threonine-protein kinase [Jatrophihabitantaceae bacterium]|jgi:hypothetical protein
MTNPDGHHAHPAARAERSAALPPTQPLSTRRGADPVPEAGAVLGDRYQLGEILARGGMSTVYRGLDHRTGRDVAVKVFRPGTDLGDADLRFHREVALLSSLNDPGLVAVVDADPGNAAEPYLVTELVVGPTLSQRIRHAPLTEHQVALLGAALSRTLAYVHEHGIVHRDVKPANILIAAPTEEHLGTPKLVDFGIAIAADGTRLTSANLTVGTPNYLSPEQVRGESVTPASDVYSLGLVLVEALTGDVAYPGTGLEAALARLSRPPLVPADTSRELRAVLTAMTASGPADRPDARQLAGRLDQVADTALAASSAPQQRSIVIAAAAVVATIAGIAGIAAVLSMSAPRQPAPANIAPPQAVQSNSGSTTAHRTDTVRGTVPGPLPAVVDPRSPSGHTSAAPAPGPASTGGAAGTRGAATTPGAPAVSAAPSTNPTTPATGSTSPSVSASSPTMSPPSPTSTPTPTVTP